jgi:hypothetical protein
VVSKKGHLSIATLVYKMAAISNNEKNNNKANELWTEITRKEGPSAPHTTDTLINITANIPSIAHLAKEILSQESQPCGL